jgi:hypothetical protein
VNNAGTTVPQKQKTRLFGGPLWNSWKNYFLTAELIIGTSLAIKTVDNGLFAIPLSYVIAIPIAAIISWIRVKLPPDNIERSTSAQVIRGLKASAVVVAITAALILVDQYLGR